LVKAHRWLRRGWLLYRLLPWQWLEVGLRIRKTKVHGSIAIVPLSHYGSEDTYRAAALLLIVLHWPLAHNFLADRNRLLQSGLSIVGLLNRCGDRNVRNARAHSASANKILAIFSAHRHPVATHILRCPTRIVGVIVIGNLRGRWRGCKCRCRRTDCDLCGDFIPMRLQFLTPGIMGLFTPRSVASVPLSPQIHYFLIGVFRRNVVWCKTDMGNMDTGWEVAKLDPLTQDL
jgi:hypothetical protein